MRRIPTAGWAATVCGAAILLAGCASVPRDAGFSEVQHAVSERAGQTVEWHRGGTEDALVDDAVRELLAEPLTPDAAVQIALLHNRRLQAAYEDLGVAQAHLVQAGLLRNPVFGFAPRWPLDGGPPELSFSVAADFLNVFTIPLRRSVAQSAFEATRQRVSAQVLAHAAATRAAFYRAQADQQLVEMMDDVLVATEAAFVAAQRLREAGNIRRIDLLSEQALYEQSRLDAEAAHLAAAASRERLNRLMGLWGEDAAWTLDGRLPLPPEEPAELGPAGGADIERRAIEASLDLAAARADIETRGRQLGIDQTMALIPDLHLGAELEREGSEWKLGPEIEIALPLLDQGQARRAAARAEVRRAQATYLALGVEVRSYARELRERVLSTRRRALHYHRVVLPLRAEVTHEMQLQYNAMQVGVFHLLQAKQQEIQAGQRYLSALADYWAARTELELLLQGVAGVQH